ncbi:TrbC/VirB2 family protein [Erythrobacter sp. YT30]|uniref:TrbC/VirB2 family protein n=1 Tax=Erythrobacter sp. YT30 TaxID=1735012 RepID=UPI00076C403C|nr:hypothetical protein AUC45_11285 [Erythrobacter sp. YT30]
MQTTLFEPSNTSISSATDWLESIVLSDIAITLCVIAVALLGFSILQGRISFQLGARCVIGIFVLLSAPTIAGGFSTLGSSAHDAAPRTIVVEARELPPLGDDPNPSASLRRE